MLDELNERQKQAVLYNDGPLLIIAGAGSGKTKTLTCKIAYLIDELNVNPGNILAITFTNKAASEMKSRIYKLLGTSIKGAQISTFHSFGVKLIMENASLLGYNSNFVIMDSDDSLTIVKKILKDLNLDTKKYNSKAIRNKISNCKNILETPDDYSKYVISDYEETVLKVYKKYEDILFKNNSVDFDDLLRLPIKLFKEHVDVLERYQDKYQYILIDEYQDTNEAQYILTKMLSSKYKYLTCVGDDAQSIYSFRGANFKNILNFEKDYKNSKIVYLEENYRSTKYILDAANAVIKNNIFKKDKNLWTSKEDGKKIKYYRAEDERDEAEYVIKNINKIIKDGSNLEDIAVLYRTNAQSRTMEEACLKNNISYKVIGGTYFYARREIKDLIAYLRLIHNTQDNVSLLRIINMPRRGIGLKTIEELTYKADRENKSIYDAIESGKPLEFKNMIENLRKLKDSLTLTEFIDKIMNSTGLLEELKQEHSLEADIRIENLEEFKSISKSFEEENDNANLEEFLLQISLVSDIEDYKNDPNRVSLMTIHQVKGLEYKHVFVIGLEEGIFPHFSSLNDEAELEEERRLCYVAITRAMEDLYLVNAKRRLIFGQTQRNIESRFIEEIPKNLLIYEDDESKFNKNIRISLNKNKKESSNINFEVGEVIYHDKFGKGVVTRVEDRLIHVAFDYKTGIKLISKNYKGLSK